MSTLRRLSSRLALALSLASVAASAQYVDLPGTQPGALDGGIPLEGARPCGASCHAASDPDAVGALPQDAWIGSMMGNTLRDPLFLAALTVAEQDRAGIGDWCLRCHTPPGFVGGRTRGSASAARGEALDLEDRDGVTCDACHRMVETENVRNAQYVISPAETRFGPRATIESPRHPGAQSAWISDARMCGVCHEVSNPTRTQRLADGTDTGRPFPLDTTYSEWARSAFNDPASRDARTCQGCHMSRLDDVGRTSTYPTAQDRDRPRRHDFAGANAWALRVLGAMREDLSSGDFYDPGLAPYYESGARRAEATLRSALSLEFRSVPAGAAPGERVEVVARVTNRSGHRVPTGYADGRRVWLELALLEDGAAPRALSGGYDAASGAPDAADPQLALYEAWHGRAGVGRSEHIALHDTVIRDTRLPPRGYRPLPGHEPVGADFSGGEAGALRHWDDRRYALTVPSSARGSVALRVRALFQATTRAYVGFLEAENRTDDRGRELSRRYAASGGAAPFVMVEATATIPVIEPVPDAGARDASGDAPGVVPPTPAGCGCRATGRAARAPWSLALLALASLRRRRARR